MDASLANDPAQVIVFQDRERSVGIAVDRILDIVEDTVVVRQQGTRRGLLGASVIGKQVTDFVDLKAVLTSAMGAWFEASSTQRGTLLLAESSPFVRGMLRMELEMAGYQVTEAQTGGEALQALERKNFNVVLASTSLPSADSSQLLDELKRRPLGERIPVLGLGTSSAEPHDGFDDYQSKFDREGMLHSIARLGQVLEHPAEVTHR
jgi:two-component system chemotaxis sensor kinase CheA